MHKMPMLVVRFAVQVVTGTLLFVAIAVAALGLNFLASIDLIASASPIMATIFRGLSYAIYLIDTLLLLIFLIKIFIRTAKELWSDEREDTK